MSPEKRVEKILRVGIVQGGRIIEERLLRPREPVTVGQSMKNKFSVPSPTLPMTSTVIDYRSGRYLLLFEKGMLGKVLVDDEVLDLKTIAQRGLADRKDNRFFFPLSPVSRGKVVVGEVTMLFQFVSPPPDIPRLQLSAGRRASVWQHADKKFLFSLLFSVILLGGTFGYMDVWWRYTGRYMAPERNPDKKVFAMLLSAKPPEAPVEEKEQEKAPDEEEKPKEENAGQANEQEDMVATMMGVEAASQAVNEAVGDSDSGSYSPSDFAGGPDTSGIQVSMGAIPAGPSIAAITPAKAGGSANIIAGRGGDGPGTVVDVLGGGKRRGTSMLDGPMVVGTGRGSFGGLAGGGGLLTSVEGAGLGVMPAGGFVVSVPRIEQPAVAVEAMETNTAEVAPSGPQIKVTEVTTGTEKRKLEGKFTTSGGSAGEKSEVGNARKKVGNRSSAIKRCYQTALLRNRTLAGRVRMRISVDMSGNATIQVLDDGLKGSGVADCIKNVIKGIAFDKVKTDPFNQAFNFAPE